MRVALAQINPILGDFQFNADQIIAYSKRALERRADIVVFPEASLFGYHPMDLLERPSVVAEQMKVLNSLTKKLPKEILVVLGAFTPNKSKNGKAFHNSAIAIADGRIKFQCAKTLLPTYDVFDDARHIEPGDMTKNVFKFKGQKILITICEDIWAWPLTQKKEKSLYSENPVKKIKPKSVDLILNLSASPFNFGKLKQRRSVVQQTASHLKAPMVYVNMVGGQDELIFDGASFAISKTGKILSQCAQFAEDLNIADFSEESGGVRATIEAEPEQVRQALVLGVRDFARKVGISKVHLGLSGGIDSAVVACLAADAMGPKAVTAFALPGPFSSDASLSLAKILAKNLGIQFKDFSINEVYETLVKPLSETLGSKEFGLMEENLQARLRGLVLMAHANRHSSVLLNTSNKTEMASGYGTLYGDMCGGLCVIGDLLKKDVYELARHYNLEGELIPAEIINRAPSAELRPDQKDQDSLPPYDELDQAVVNMVEHMKVPKTQAEKFLLPALFKSEFKRWQSPPVLKVRPHSFGRGRRMPVAHRAFY